MMKFGRALAIAVCAIIIFAGMSFMAKDTVIGMGTRIAATASFVVMATAIWLMEYKSNSCNCTKKKPVKEGFDWSMHYFRAFAILAIILMHYCSAFGYNQIVNIIFHSSTIFFLFISGYLCKYIDQRHRVSATVYYEKKAINVILPFIVFSIIFGLMKGKDLFSLAFLKEMALGEVQGQYWYIPFVSILFLISPYVCRFDNHKLILTWVVSAFFFLLFPIRPGGFSINWPNTVYLYSYFSVFYFTGFVYCVYKDSINSVINKYWYLFAVGAAAVTLVLWIGPALRLSVASYDLMIGVQKFLFVVLAIYGLGYIRNNRIPILDLLAKYSFTLYFIHFGLFAQSHRFHDYLVQAIPMPLVITETIVFVLFVGGMLCVSILFKLVLGKYSRALLGT
ncbi:MAG: acyltransferase [Kiritimatiellae bacterium]|nr:acyltransferase [Kiritimatiellia bacterium]